MVDHIYKQKKNRKKYQDFDKDSIRKTENICDQKIIWTRKKRLSNLNFLHRNKTNLDLRVSISIEKSLTNDEITDVIQNYQEVAIRAKNRISFRYPKKNSLYSVDVTYVQTYQHHNNPHPQISNEIEIECLDPTKINYKTLFTLYIILLKCIKDG